MDDCFYMIYFKDGLYINYNQILEQKTQGQIAQYMNKYMNQYLDKVHRQILYYQTDTFEQCQYYVEQVYNFFMQFCQAGKELQNYNKFTITMNWKEYHKSFFITRILYDQRIQNDLNIIQKKYGNIIEKTQNLMQLIQENKTKNIQYESDLTIKKQNVQIKTHQDLMKYWIIYSQCEDLGVDEIKDFERRLECAIVILPDSEKQIPNLPQNWEENFKSIYFCNTFDSN